MNNAANTLENQIKTILLDSGRELSAKFFALNFLGDDTSEQCSEAKDAAEELVGQGILISRDVSDSRVTVRYYRAPETD